MRPWSQPLLWPHPSGAVACDPYFGNVVLLMGFEGVNGSTGAPGMTDESPAAHGVATGLVNATISNTKVEFGSTSLFLNSGRIQYANSNDWNFGAGNFTLELWVNFNSLAGIQRFISTWNGTNDSNLGFTLGMTSAGTRLTWEVSTTGINGLIDINAVWAPVINQWYFITLDYNGTTYRAYVNGTMIGSSTTARTIFNSTHNLNIGSDNDGSSPLLGYMDELRITKGVARYASDGVTTAAPTFVTAGTRSEVTAASVTPALPASRVNGNLLIAYCRIEGASVANSISTSAGWSTFSPIHQGTAQRASILAYRYVDGTETAPVFTLSATDIVVAQIVQYTGTISVNPIGNVSLGWYDGSSGFDAGSSLPPRCPVMNAANPNSTALSIALFNTGTPSVPSGFTSRTGSGSFALLCDKTLTNVGDAAGPVSDPAGGIANWTEYIVEIRSPSTPAFAVPTAAFPRVACSTTGTTATWNPADKSAQITLSGGNLIATDTSTGDSGVRSTTSHSGGKWYIEWTSGSTFTGANTNVGICTIGAPLAGVGNTTANAFLLQQGGSGAVWFNGSQAGLPQIGQFFTNRIAGMAIDLVNMRGWFRVDGASGLNYWNGNASYDPATNIGGVDISALFPSNAAYPVFTSNGNGSICSINSTFTYMPPGGFSPW